MVERRVDVLVFAGCPGVDVTLTHVRTAIESTHVPATVHVSRVESAEDAQRLRFLGSPTVRIDGVDVEPSAQQRTDFGLQCRVYRVRDHFEPAPPADLIIAALRMT